MIIKLSPLKESKAVKLIVIFSIQKSVENTKINNPLNKTNE
jgi:hypothetical protein